VIADARPTRAPRATAVAAVLAWLALAGLAAAAPPVDEHTVREIAAELRCVVCQSLSVADSPSETANQMRGVIRERLAAGDTPEQVKAYFVDKYGLWILLSPPRRGFNLLVWVVPFAGLLAGLALVAVVVRRWSRRPQAPSDRPAPDDAMRQRIAREMADLDR
jgi:cytochrome c-type biogenesis protein CcmH